MKTSDKVYNYIEGNIIKGVWKAGDKITPELSLVKELEVSRMSVREAIEKMVALGILSKTRGGGTYVNEVTSSTYMNTLLPLLTMDQVSYMEILEFRLATDILAVERFIDFATKEDIDKLGSVHECMVEAKEDKEKFFEYDMAFHRTIAEGASNGILQKITAMLFDITEHFTKDQYYLLTADKRIEEHTKIYQTILNKDKELARIYMKRHLERTINELKKR